MFLRLYRQQTLPTYVYWYFKYHLRRMWLWVTMIGYNTIIDFTLQQKKCYLASSCASSQDTRTIALILTHSHTLVWTSCIQMEQVSCLKHVTSFDFSWQQTYFFEHVQKWDTMEATVYWEVWLSWFFIKPIISLFGRT